MSRRSIKPLAAAIGASFLATTLAPLAAAGENPFALSELKAGYQVAQEEKAAEGKCGAGKTAEGKCGAEKAAEGKCGAEKTTEGKCGAGKSATEGKCGEGKCGAGKTAGPSA